MKGNLPRSWAAALRRHLLLTVTATVLLLAVVGTGVAEYTVRGVIQNRVVKAAPGLGADVAVGVAGGWALWNLAQGSIPRLDISSDEARVGRLSHVRVRARLDDVRPGDTTTVGGSRVQVAVSTQSLAAAIREAVPSVAVGRVTTDPAQGKVLAEVGPGGVGRLALRPVLADGKVTLAVDALTLFGRYVPTDRLGIGEGGLGPQAGAPKEYPLGLAATSAEVRPDGLHIALAGGPSVLSHT
ncbi:LmeA family phospholipid-binding protein [Streptomyces sp. 3211]|uniref:LmeA family phospholipid-binding protein n=1 Tax=Streptomyces sp. 3211 TaxID=1964449 RepID=UPI0009A53872|nr:LmeA family phospholipid-binding protein [Streptomyces sp. 3211]